MSKPWEDFDNVAVETKPWEDFGEETPTSEFRDLSSDQPLQISAPRTIPRTGALSTTSGGQPLNVGFDTDFRGPKQTIADALSEAYNIGTGDPSESLLGIRPEGVPTGKEISEQTGLPGALTVPASALVRAGAGLGQFLTSVGGGTEIGTSAVPGVGLLQRAKWIYDMASGLGESSGDLSAKLEMAAKSPNKMTTDDWQGIADDAANTALMLYGSGKLTSHEFSKLTGIRAPLGRVLESEKTRISKDVAEQLKKAELTPTEKTAESIRQLGVKVPVGEFAQPGILKLADAALSEAGNKVIVPGQEGAALGALQRAIVPPQVVGETIARSERLAGGGKAPYGKVSFMRPAEAPVTESTRAALSREKEQAAAQPESMQQRATAGAEPYPKAEGAKPLIVAGKRLADGEIVYAREHRAFEQEQVPGESGYLVVPPDVDPMIFERDLARFNPDEQAKLGIKFVSIPEAQSAKGDIELASKQKSATQPSPTPAEPEAKPSPVITEKAEPSPVPPVAAEVSKAEKGAVSAAPSPPAISQAKPSGEITQAAEVKPETKPGLISGTKLDKWADDVLRGGATHLAPEVFAAYLVRGAALIERGVVRFAEWSAKMVEMYGPAIEPHLKAVFDAASNTLKRAPITETGTLKSAREIVESRLGQQASAATQPAPVSQPTTQAQPAQVAAVPSINATAQTHGYGPRITSATPPPAGAINVTKITTKQGTVYSYRLPLAQPTPVAPVQTVPTPPRTATVTLDDIYKIFEPEKKSSTPLKQRAVNIIEAFRTGLSSKFRPLNKLAEDIAKSYGLTSRKDIAGIMEQLKGSRGKGEADIYRFDRAVSDLVKGQELDFNAYMFLRRSLDRLRQDASNPANQRRAVAAYSIPVLEAKLALLEQKLGGDLPRFQQAADAYQAHLDKALRLQVESGRMSQEVYDKIKSENQFYAPFKVMRWIEETAKPEGTGRKVDTVADYTKAMEGIEDPNFKLGDMLAAGRQNIMLSRVLADKAVAMRNVADLATTDTQGLFIRKMFPTQTAPKGWSAVNVFENGKKVRYMVRSEVADALEIYGPTGGGVVSQILGAFSVPFKMGATALNIPFQVSNLLADIPRQALASKYGLRGVTDLLWYPIEIGQAMYSSMKGNMLGSKNQLFLDFLDSGAAHTTIQEHLTPKALQYRDPTTMSKAKRTALNIVYAPAEFAAAIEQTSKILGVKRAMRFEGAQSGAELAKRIPEAVTEIRRFSGSPDFGRQGKWVEQARLNLLYMFLNARIQGVVADVGRLTGRDGWKRAAITWARVGTAIGLPTAYLYSLNNRPEYKEDYDKLPKQAKDNYWHIPLDRYIVNEDGEKMRDYWRIPKRESAKWIANMTESALDFADKRDPETFRNFSQRLIEDISPVNIQGNTAQERMESVGASLNPVIKGPLEVATGRDMYRHRTLVPEKMQKASPEQQYTDRTAQAFKTLAELMPDVAPEFLRSPIMLENMTRNLTAGLITQFIGGKPVEGRGPIANLPLLQRFQRTPYTDNEAFTKEIQSLERESADEYLNRHRAAVQIMETNKNAPLATLVRQAGRDVKLMQQVVDLWTASRNGATRQDRQLIALPAKQRAEYIAKLFSTMTPEVKRKAIVDLAKKRVLTESVFQELPSAMKSLEK